MLIISKINNILNNFFNILLKINIIYYINKLFTYNINKFFYFKRNLLKL